MIRAIQKNKAIILIILIAAFLRLYGISRGDPVNDEALMAFRAIGMIDFDEAEFQTTPFEWFDPQVQDSTTVPAAYHIGTGIPWWAHLSWHDHPALVFAVQHFFMTMFGDNVGAFRLPSALLGVLSVYLIYLIGQRLYEKRVGLYAALLYAVTLNGIYISRTGMQEPYVIFFILLTLYFFLRALENEKYFFWSGITLGLGMLAKYTVFFAAAPIMVIYLLLYHRNVLKSKKLWLGILCFFVVISPSIIYNIELYRAVGHFDFQFSEIFRQAHPVWQVEPGKDIGTLTDRIRAFIPRMIATKSWLFLALFVMSIVGFIVTKLHYERNIAQPDWGEHSKFSAENYARSASNGSFVMQRGHSFLIISFCVLILLLLGIGPSYRFLTMLTPFMALSIGIFLTSILEETHINPRTGFEPVAGTVRAKRESAGLIPERDPLGRARKVRGLMWVLVLVIILFEMFYSWNNQIAYYPMGSEPWLSSKVRYENYNWGYNELNNYFEKEFAGKVPALSFDLRYQFLNQLRDAALQQGLHQGLPEYPALVVYFGNFDKAGRLWSLDRLHIYHAWPVISLQDYYDYLKTSGADFYTKAGFKDFYFVIPTNTVSVPSLDRLVQGIQPIEIKNPRGDTAFLVYKKI